ncbi:MAG: Spore photoproduct lyase [Lentisphaerae bacterium ADurb.BinA184]|nr:MAG: Spore photoproduct lyase [Lentisphaerae bacterium ADurb.BinA184]
MTPHRKTRPPTKSRAPRAAVRLRPRKTPFVSILRTTPPTTVCPNFYVLGHANGCAFAPLCSYCYLKSSLWHLDGPHVFTNTDSMLDEVRAWIAKDGLESYVLNAGNLSDSLVFEDSRPIVPLLVELFREHAEKPGRPHTLLLVTKGGAREAGTLLDAPPCANVIVSFSVNHPEAAERYEKGAASTRDRLETAGRLKRAGWRIRLRIDPMIRGYDYTGLAREVAALKPERVTLGSLRAEANLFRHAPHPVFEELSKPDDPRQYARYPWAERVAMYNSVLDILRGVCPLALCEETPQMWDETGLDKVGARCNCNV